MCWVGQNHFRHLREIFIYNLNQLTKTIHINHLTSSVTSGGSSSEAIVGAGSSSEAIAGAGVWLDQTLSAIFM